MKGSRETNHQGIQTCHLCGKVQCGQRLGRVKCRYCSRIFCLQQLQRKFGIVATANDPNFKCPRCTGVCCCMCNCQRPPPHVHCKVYKVRQNKIKNLEENNAKEEPSLSMLANSIPMPRPIPEKAEYIAPPKKEIVTIPPTSATLATPGVMGTASAVNSASVVGNVNNISNMNNINNMNNVNTANSIGSMNTAGGPAMSTAPSLPRVFEPPHMLFPVETPSVPRIPSLTGLDAFPPTGGRDEAKLLDAGRWDAFASGWQEPQSSWHLSSNDLPGSGRGRRG